MTKTAAAPELLEALEQLTETIRAQLSAFEPEFRKAIGSANFALMHSSVETARAAIAKAKGETP